MKLPVLGSSFYHSSCHSGLKPFLHLSGSLWRWGLRGPLQEGPAPTGSAFSRSFPRCSHFFHSNAFQLPFCGFSFPVHTLTFEYILNTGLGFQFWQFPFLLLLSLFFNGSYVSEQFQVYSKIKWKVQRVVIYLLPLSHQPPLPTLTSLTREAHLLQLMTYTGTSLSPKVHSYIRVHS